MLALSIVMALPSLVACSEPGSADPVELPSSDVAPISSSTATSPAASPTSTEAPTPEALEQQALAITRQATLRKFPEWLRAHAPAGTQVEFVRDITPSTAPADRLHFRIQARADSPDPLTALLGSQTDVVAVDLVSSKDTIVLLDATLRLDPSH